MFITKINQFIFTLLLLFFYSLGTAQTSDLESIRLTLLDYIEGTANGEPERLERAFHPDFNLYSVSDSDSLNIWDGQGYIDRIKPGKKNNRVGRIISIDHENNAASAKVEILMPGYRIYTDYFLLLKYQGNWKIVHKSFSWRPIPTE